MQYTHKSVRALAVSLVTFGSLAGGANAALVLTVSEYTSSAITVSINGTLDASTSSAPISPGIFFIAPNVNLSTQWYVGELTLESGDFLIGGVDYFGPTGANNGSNTGYSIAFLGATSIDTPVVAGTSIVGTVRMTGTIDDAGFSASDFNLYSGQVAAKEAFRLEASAVPEPSSAFSVGLGAIGLAAIRRRKNR